jgi:hypothetical protein
MSFDPKNLAEKFEKYGNDWCQKKAAADLLLRTSKNLKAKICLEKLPDAGSVAKADIMAEASHEYDEQCKMAIEAQRQENLAWVKFEQAKVYIDLIRSQQATERAALTIR